MKPTRRAIGDPIIWEFIHWFTMVILRHRIVRGYDKQTGRFTCIYWDKASNWQIMPVEGGTDYVRQNVPYPDPIWKRG